MKNHGSKQNAKHKHANIFMMYPIHLQAPLSAQL